MMSVKCAGVTRQEPRLLLEKNQRNTLRIVMEIKRTELRREEGCPLITHTGGEEVKERHDEVPWISLTPR